jgi:hypothetical protein
MALELLHGRLEAALQSPAGERARLSTHDSIRWHELRCPHNLVHAAWVGNKSRHYSALILTDVALFWQLTYSSSKRPGWLSDKGESAEQDH